MANELEKLAGQYYDSGNWFEAEKLYMRILASDNQNTVAMFRLAYINVGKLDYGMAEMLSIRLSTKINMAEDPENSVVNGLGKALEDFSMLKNHDYHFRSLEDLMVE